MFREDHRAFVDCPVIVAVGTDLVVATDFAFVVAVAIGFVDQVELAGVVVVVVAIDFVDQVVVVVVDFEVDTTGFAEAVVEAVGYSVGEAGIAVVGIQVLDTTAAVAVVAGAEPGVLVVEVATVVVVVDLVDQVYLLEVDYFVGVDTTGLTVVVVVVVVVLD